MISNKYGSTMIDTHICTHLQIDIYRYRQMERWKDGQIDRWKDGRMGIDTVRDTRQAKEIETKEKPYNKFLKIYSLTTYVYTNNNKYHCNTHISILQC